MEQRTATIPFDLETAKKINIGEIAGRIVTEKGQNRAEIVYEDNSSNCPLLVVIHSISVSADWFSATGKALSSANRLLLEVPEYITFKDGEVLSNKDGSYIFILNTHGKYLTSFYASLNQKGILKIVEEVPVIKYQLETNCMFSYDKNGNIVPNPSKEWTGGDENGEWRDGTSRLDALNAQPFGFSVYAKPFLKRVIEYGNGETKVEYSRLNTEKGTYAHWLNCVTSISYNRYKQVMEVECNECTSKLFVDMIKSICNISEQVKSFINPEQIKAIAGSNEPILLLSNN